MSALDGHRDPHRSMAMDTDDSSDVRQQVSRESAGIAEHAVILEVRRVQHHLSTARGRDHSIAMTTRPGMKMSPAITIIP
jgi:hypothetical protein